MGDNDFRFISYPKKGYTDFITYEDLVYILKEWLRRGERSIVDFKRENIQPKDLAESIGAIANTNSGLIVLGVDQKDSKNPWKGVINVDKWINNLSNLKLDVFADSLDLRWITFTLPNKKTPLILIFVPLVMDSILTYGRYYYRIGASTRYAKDEETIRKKQEKKQGRELGFTIFKKMEDFLVLCKQEDPDLKTQALLTEELKKQLTTDITTIIDDIIDIRLFESEILEIINLWRRLEKYKLQEEYSRFRRRETYYFFFLALVPIIAILIRPLNLSSVLIEFLSNIQLTKSLLEFVTTGSLVIYYYSLLLLFYSFRMIRDLSLSNLFPKEYRKREFLFLKLPFFYPNLDILERSLKRNEIADTIITIQVIILHLKIYLGMKSEEKIQIKNFREYSKILFEKEIEIDPLFDPFYPIKDFKDWLEKKNSSLRKANWLDLIEESRIYNIFTYFSVKEEEHEKIASRLNKSKEELTELLEQINKWKLFQYERYYLIFKLEELLEESYSN